MSLPCSCLFLLLLAPAADEKKPSPYPRADLLIEANELAKEEAATKLRILDARGKSKYIEGHIPGSDWVDVVTWSKAFVSDPDPEAWGGRLGGVRLHDAEIGRSHV